MERALLIAELARRVAAVRRPHPVRVAVDGVDGAGKTRLADELVQPLESLGRPVIRASVDGFHRPRAERYRRGRASPEGYYRDSFDLETLRAALLDPLGPAGDRTFRRAAFDHREDRPVALPPEEAPADAVLVFDGVFLQRPELAGCWDLTVFLDVPFAISVARMAARDGGDSDPAAPGNRRYVEGQRLYLDACRPREAAHLAIDNADLARPRWIGSAQA